MVAENNVNFADMVWRVKDEALNYNLMLTYKRSRRVLVKNDFSQAGRNFTLTFLDHVCSPMHQKNDYYLVLSVPMHFYLHVAEFLKMTRRTRLPHNIHCGIEVHHQPEIEEKAGPLLTIPCHHHFVWAKPHRPLSLWHNAYINKEYPFSNGAKRIDQVICSAPFYPYDFNEVRKNILALQKECQEHNVPFVFDSWGPYAPCGFRNLATLNYTNLKTASK